MLYQFSHKTGTYAVSIVEEKADQTLVQIEQVVKHPKQGDLHNPNDVEGVFFHERRALSQFEKRYTPKSRLKPFEGEEQSYTASLQDAITALEDKLKTKDTEHSALSLKCLNTLKEDYGRQYKTEFK
ncbi:sporulation phosphorelay system protein KapB [Staphylococcus massiliensis]|uniref:Kinase-associated protein B n=1 Tax=Staphylococcus massiliensis S46 TaxID=1229783 RepID=K9APU8_9STAP|nr:sporulation phosphorelay system protein KapB [Staphylococcus massiliensis]EKU48046.1 kinase-associated protein B [Staphylococcus massiliensis S46]MCG3400016.1 kinase-associated lipoprotein B [Staphylococcus massiliensis]MCG3401643.1 kinase-associated lipoprotein B [Staphylococcus massiliensis]MCG3412177.1 kinase-associated lipoprotein B [Staphylococcus massiliensis]POA00065.1 kinase [Staphylococcus massiliensis CCUG 55927]